MIKKRFELMGVSFGFMALLLVCGPGVLTTDGSASLTGGVDCTHCPEGYTCLNQPNVTGCNATVNRDHPNCPFFTHHQVVYRQLPEFGCHAEDSDCAGVPNAWKSSEDDCDQVMNPDYNPAN